MEAAMPYLPQKCPNCRERRVVRVTEQYETTIEHDGREYPISIADLSLLRCEACGNRVLTGEADDRVSRALRTAAGLLTPEEIRARRSALNLTQLQVAEALGIAPARFSRWEAGSQIQDHLSDRMLRAFFDLPELRRYLAAPGQRLAPFSAPVEEPPRRMVDI
jgi:putative zinc finger/helix-turn-helix YgiT family protein